MITLKSIPTRQAFWQAVLCIMLLASSLVLPGLVSFAQVTAIPKVSLFAKSQSGDYYTVSQNGIPKEDAYIGGFKSVQLDPLEENLYFYDPTLKVIARINLQDGKVYKVIGKPKSSSATDYSKPVKFNDATLPQIKDFTFDKYGNIYILILADLGNPTSGIQPNDPRILKASLKEGTVKEVFRPYDAFQVTSGTYLPGYQYFSFNINGLNYDNERYIYVFGTFSYYPLGYGTTHWNGSKQNTPLVFKFDTVANTAEFTSGGEYFSFPSKIQKDPNTNYSTTSILGLSLDHKNNIFLHQFALSPNYYFTDKLVSATDSNGQSILKPDRLIGNSNVEAGEIGDGALAKDASAGIVFSRSICEDQNGDIYLADSGNSRVRKIVSDTGFVTTIVGSGKELLSFGEEKSPKIISLSNPYSLCVDKSNNLYITELNRILVVKSLVTHYDKPKEQVKVANLSITKVAGVEVKNPKGEITVPDLSLDYTYSGDKTVEVKGENIPDGTNVKLLNVKADGQLDGANSTGVKLQGGYAIIPVKVEAGITKVIKAETDPFVPAPGVYLASSVPQTLATNSITLPTEPQNQTPKRDEVNTGNGLPLVSRFNFTNTIGGWIPYSSGIMIKTYATVDPDASGSDVALIDFGSSPNLLRANTENYTQIKFSVWMRTDSGNINVPLGIGPNCPDFKQYWYFGSSGWEGCNYPYFITQGQTPPLLSYRSFTVTPTWQKFTVTSGTNLNNNAKHLFIGGLNQTTNQKIYLWGAKVETVQ